MTAPTLVVRSVPFRTGCWGLALLLWLGASSCALGQIRTDGSLGHAPQSLTGPTYVIPQSLGLLSGPNLFQSFSTFNLAVGEAAYFLTSTAGIANIISRVTGGTPSTLYGNINVLAASGAPNFFFLNPAGITFGAGASINVPAAIHVSTASYLKFPDGNFYSDLAHVSTFSALAPEAFGFLGSSRATITVGDGSFIAQAGAPISIVGGDIVVDDATVATFGTGDVRIAAVGADQVEVPFSGPLPTVHGNLTVSNGGSIAALATNQDSGKVAVSAGNIDIDSKGSAYFTGIYTDAPQGSTGNSSALSINASGAVTLVNFGAISTTTEASGNAGPLSITAAGPLSLSGGAQIYSASYVNGNAGAVQVQAGSISMDGSGGPPSSGIYSFGSAGSGNSGNVTVGATGNINLTNGAFIAANSYTSGNAGAVSVTAGGSLVVSHASSIGADADGTGAAGAVSVSAASISLLGSPNSFTGISSNSDAPQSGAAGSISVTTPGALTIVAGADINSVTGSSSDAGSIRVKAGSLAIDGQDVPLQTGISTNTEQGLGNAGSVSVTVAGLLSILNGGEISSDSELSLGNSGQVNVSAGSLFINGGGHSIAGISSDLTALSATARGGDVNVTVSGQLTIRDGGQISADTHLAGSAGAVNVQAGSILIDADNLHIDTGISSTSSPDFNLPAGNAGSISVHSQGSLTLLDGGSISSSTFSSAGRAGSIQVTADQIAIDGFLSSIDAQAFPGSSGQTGRVSVAATDSIVLSNRGEISITNAATVPDPGVLSPSLISLSAPDITLSGLSLISALALGNTSASDIHIQFGNELSLDPSAISTSSFTGNGGSIVIQGGRLLELNQSQITTSVFGSNGNGGNITIATDALLLNSGFIQANTAAVKASGGDVAINADVLVASGSSLFVGGSTPFIFDPEVFGFNVIQAAAPTGISGTIQISNPALNLAGSLSALGEKFLTNGGLGHDRCHGSAGSSLALGGRGGFAPSGRGLVRATPDDFGPLAASGTKRELIALKTECAR